MTALAITTIVYIAISIIAIGAVGSKALAASAQPLDAVASAISPSFVVLVAFGALVATASVVFGDLLTSSRAMFAMGRRSDLPAILGKVDKKSGAPGFSIVATGIIALIVVSIGNLTFAALLTSLTILIYYSITNFTALKLGRSKRLYPRILSVFGAFGCIGLALFLPAKEWIVTAVLVVITISYYIISKNFRRT